MVLDSTCPSCYLDDRDVGAPPRTLLWAAQPFCSRNRQYSISSLGFGAMSFEIRRCTMHTCAHDMLVGHYGDEYTQNLITSLHTNK